MCRTIAGLLAAMAAAMFTCQASAADAAKQRDAPPGPPMMFQRLDKNRDGKITADEIPQDAPESVKEMAKQADKNGDNIITAEELRAAHPGFGRGPGRRPVPGFAGRAPGGPDRPRGGPDRPQGGPDRPRGGPDRPRGGPDQPQGGPTGRPGAPQAGPPRFGGPGAPPPESLLDPKALFRLLDKDGDQKLSPEEFAEGVKIFHWRMMAGERPPMGPPPMMGQGPMGPFPGMGPPPMMRHRPFPPGGPMMHPGMRGQWGARGPFAWSMSPWARRAWGGYAHRWRARGGPGAVWAKHRRPTADGAAILRRLQAADTNKDGKISKSESPQRLLKHFDKLDANKDGQLDKTELGKAMATAGKEIREAMGKRRAEMIRKSQEARGEMRRKNPAEKKRDETQQRTDEKVRDKKAEDKTPEKK